jgi:hypothetical protein
LLAQRETDMPVVLDDFTAGRHRSQRRRRLADFLDPAGFPPRGGSKQFQRFVPQGVERPQRLAPCQPERSFIASASAN